LRDVEKVVHLHGGGLAQTQHSCHQMQSSG
jgi:hypothetical protein